MVQSDLVLPQIVPGTNIKRCQKKRRPHKKASRQAGAANTNTTTTNNLPSINVKGERNCISLPACFSSLYKTDPPKLEFKNEGVASRHVLPPPTSLPSIPASVTKPANRHPLETGANSTGALANHHLPKLRLTHHLGGTTAYNGERPYVSEFTLKGTSMSQNGIKTSSNILNNHNKASDDSTHSIESLQSELKLDLPHNIERFQTGADMCSIINLCMPLPSKLRTSTKDNNHPKEFVQNKSLVKETLVNSVNDTCTKCEHNESCSSSLGVSSLTSSKLPSSGQLDHFNSALIQLKRVVSDSTHQKKEQSKETTMKNVKIGEKSAPTNNSTSFKIERQNESRHLNIIDLEKQTSLLVRPAAEEVLQKGHKARPLTHHQIATPRRMVCLNKGSLYSPKSQANHCSVKGTNKRIGSSRNEDCPPLSAKVTRDNKIQSYSENRVGHLRFSVCEEQHKGLTTQCSKRCDDTKSNDSRHVSSNELVTVSDHHQSRHSMHVIHHISLPNDNEGIITSTERPTTIGLTNKKYIGPYEPTGSGYHRTKSSHTPRNQFQHMTPFAYYHMLRQNSSATKRSGSVPPSPLHSHTLPSHPPLQSAGFHQSKRPYLVSFHHSLHSDLTIEGNCGLGEDTSMQQYRTCGNLPQLTVKSSESIHVSVAKLTPWNSPAITPCPSYRRQRQGQTSPSKFDKKDGPLYLDPFSGANSRYKWKVSKLQDKENSSIKREKKSSK